MKVAFAILPEKGHIHPYLGTAQALTDAGHTVVVAAPGDISAQIGRAGLTFRQDLIRVDANQRITRGAELVALVQDSERLSLWIEQLLLGNVAGDVGLLRAWLQKERADVVVVDPLYYAAAIAAALEEVPWASVSNSLNPVVSPETLDSALLRTVERLRGRRAALFRSFGIEADFAVCDVLSPYLTLAFATEALVGKPPAGVTLVGPSLPVRARGDETVLQPLPLDRPIVYASFGSQIYYWPEVFEKLYAAGRLLHAHTVLSVGDLLDEPRWSAPRPHCDVYRYAPQPELLRRASVFVTHGGANSVMESIAAGVPMLVSPMCNDQFHQAFFVEQAGVGAVLDLTRASLEQIVALLRQLLADPTSRARMQAVAETYQSNGAATAARLIAALMGTERRGR